MLSILIPIYNFDVNDLVIALHQQCLACGIEFEIRCYDDASKKEFKKINQSISSLDHVVYQELTENIGRSKIRNQLGQTARYEYLLFMDGDSKLNHNNYIQLYLDSLAENSLIYGGGSYSVQPPENQALYFHWFYGTYREQLPVKERILKGHHSFKTNNFLIPKKTFSNILFDESLTQYGHEDTMFGLALKEKRIPIIHIENPLEHIGLEQTDVFLQKNKMAIENLWQLAQNNDLIDTSLLRVYRKVEHLGLSSFALRLYRLFEGTIESNLKSKKPSLRYFDLYKLATLLRFSQLKNQSTQLK